MSFAVKPPTLDAGSEAFGELLEAMSPLTLACIGPMQPGKGGFLINGFAQEVETIRQKLLDQYGFDGPCRTFFINMAQELRGLAYDYREADTEAAELRSELEKLLAGRRWARTGESTFLVNVQVEAATAPVSVGDSRWCSSDDPAEHLRATTGSGSEITGNRVSDIAGLSYLDRLAVRQASASRHPITQGSLREAWTVTGSRLPARSIGALKAVASAWSQVAERPSAGMLGRDGLEDWSGERGRRLLQRAAVSSSSLLR